MLTWKVRITQNKILYYRATHNCKVILRSQHSELLWRNEEYTNALVSGDMINMLGFN